MGEPRHVRAWIYAALTALVIFLDWSPALMAWANLLRPAGAAFVAIELTPEYEDTLRRTG